MAFQAEETHAGADLKPFRKQYRLFHAAWAQFCYTGAQVAIAGYFINYVYVLPFCLLVIPLLHNANIFHLAELKPAPTPVLHWARNSSREPRAPSPSDASWDAQS